MPPPLPQPGASTHRARPASVRTIGTGGEPPPKGTPQKGGKKAGKKGKGKGVAVPQQSLVCVATASAAILKADPHRSAAEAEWLAQECIGASAEPLGLSELVPTHFEFREVSVDKFCNQLRESLVQPTAAPASAARAPKAQPEPAAEYEVGATYMVPDDA